MSTLTTRWTRNAILARLAASDSIDQDTAHTPRERAERRVELLRLAGDLEAGRIDGITAEAGFWSLRNQLVAGSAAA